MAVVVLMLTACGGGDAPGRGFQRPPATVEATAAELRVLVDRLEAIGTARANESVVITAKVTDTVSRVRFSDGDLVSRGDVLVEMTSAEETALLAEAEANVKDARTQYNRLADLLVQQSIPVSQVDEADARLQAAIAREESLEARLQDRLVKAPFSGLLGFRSVSEGTLLTNNTPITTLDDVSLIKLDFSVPEIHVGKLRPGQEVNAYSDAFPEVAFPAEIKTLDSRVDPTTRAVVVRAHVANDERLLRPGMLLKVQVVLGRERVLMVPETALQARGDDVFVYVVDEGRALMRAVDIGARQDGWAHVIAGLDSGERVVSAGVIKVRDGSPVNVLGEDEVVQEGRSGAGGRPAGQQKRQREA